MKLIIILIALAYFPFLANSQIVDVNFSGEGVTSYSSWSNVNAFNYSGYGSFPGSQPWPSPIQATDGSTTASLNRIAGSPTGGGPFLASESIYFGSFQQVPNALGGTLQIFESAPILDLKTLVFQIQIGEAIGYDFFQPTGFPKVSINGGSYSFATFTNLVNRFQNGVFPSPETGQDEPVYVNTLAYQWNFAPETFNSLSIDFSGVTHSQVYALRVDGTDVLQSTPVIPEPSTFGLLAISAIALLFYLVRKGKRL